MLTQASITPIVHVADLERARKYYRDVLGLREEEPHDGNVCFAAGRGAHLELMLKPEAVSKDATVLSFEVDDLDTEKKELEARGARFEPVDVPGADRAAWLRDSEGNWLCVHVADVD